MTCHMAVRFASLVVPVFVLGCVSPAPAADRTISIAEALLRATPGVVLVTTEVAAKVRLDCGRGTTTVEPPPYRETGTGWFIDSRGWVITNGHVVQAAYETPRWLVNQQAQRAVTVACLPKALERAGLIPGERPDREDAVRRKVLDRVLPTAKVTLEPRIVILVQNGAEARAEVAKYGPPFRAEPGDAMSARDLAVLKIPGDNFPVLRLAGSKPVQVGDTIHIIGYPAVVLQHELLDQSGPMAPSVTKGTVSGFQKDKNNHPLIQTDASAAWGNSGGPAVDDRGTVVGVLTYVSVTPGPEGSIVQGFNFVIPSDAVKTFIRDRPINLESIGKFNPIWYAALRAFFTDDWKGAVRQFEQADTLVSGLPDVTRMLGEAREKVKNPPPRPFPWFWVALGVTLVSAGGYGAQLYIRWQRNRYRVRPADVIRLMEAGQQPVLLDIRKTEEYEKVPLRLPGSVRLAPEEFETGAAGLELEPTRPIVAYCT